MGLSVNYFGTFPTPINPDFLPESEKFGQLSDRPIGLSFEELFKLYWGFKSYDVAIQVFNIADPLIDFFQGGGFTSTALGATAGLNFTANNIANGWSLLTGKTKIGFNFKQKHRLGKREENGPEINLYTMQGVVDGKTIKEFRLNPELKNLLLSFNIQNVNEGTLCSPGIYHKVVNPYGSVIIDFSSVIYRQKKYWPKIIISFANGVASNVSGQEIQGGILFNNALIKLAATGPVARNINFLIANGYILPSKSCCGRFFYDGFDEDRKKECKC